MGITLFLTLVMIILSAMQIVDLLPLAMIVTSLFVLIGNISWSQSLAAIPVRFHFQNLFFKLL